MKNCLKILNYIKKCKNTKKYEKLQENIIKYKNIRTILYTTSSIIYFFNSFSDFQNTPRHTRWT